MWLSGMKRACVMPIYHGYARLFAGIFHDDGGKGSSKDTFIGRVAIELARLRPGRTYDVTLPLRLSTGVYSRRKRGAVRLRLSLGDVDAKEVLLSYLPGRRNRLAGRPATTVACGDPRSFRAVALTVHGKHLPGKLSTESLMATVREFTFVQKSVMRIAQKFVKDLVVWRYPAVSSFTLFGWMHCVLVSTSLVPVYMLGMVVLQLMRNYARCMASGKGLQPTSLGGILLALKDSVSGDNKKVRPIEVEKMNCDDARGGGVSLFHILGMLKNDEYFVDGVDTYAHKEFPFSSLAGYPRFHVEEATKNTPTGKSDLDADSEKDDKMIADTIGNADDAPAQNQPQSHLSESDQAAYVPRLHFETPLPEQNIDKKKQKSDKTLAEELQAVKEKAHKYTLQLFDDNHPYLITDTSTPPWGRRQQRSEKNGEEYDVKRDLDKLLGLGQYSHWNPMVSKFTVQIEPLVGVFEVALCAYRSVYNIFTWRDPFLSFWVLVFCIVAIVVLLLFPWKAVFFAVGVIALGPQNWLFRELVSFKNSRVRPGRLLRAFQELLKSDEGKKDPEEAKQTSRQNNEGDVSPQPIFQYHAPTNKANDVRKETIGAQHIRIPYTPLYYHRFYDWPPDPRYGSVTKGMPFDSSTLSAPAQAEIVTVRELPMPPQGINQACSTNEDTSEEANDVSGVVQVLASKVKEVIPVPPTPTLSTSSRPLTEMSLQTDALPQLQTTEAVSSTSETGNNAAAGKVWSRALNNLNKKISERSTEKEIPEKKPAQRKDVSSDKDGAKDKMINMTKKLSAGAMSMGRRRNINWLSAGMGQKDDLDSTMQNSTVHKDDQIKHSDQDDESSSVCSGEEENGCESGSTGEETCAPLVDKISGGQEQDKKSIWQEGGPLLKKSISEVIDEHTLIPLPSLGEEAVATSGLGDDAHEILADSSGPTSPPTEITKKDECKSDPQTCDDTGYSRNEEVKLGILVAAIYNSEDSTDVLIPTGTHGEEEGNGGDLINIEATSPAENTTKAPSPQSESDLLLEKLMALKLELATVQTRNDYYQRVLKETEEELNTYRKKCIQYERKQSFKKLTSQFTKKK